MIEIRTKGRQRELNDLLKRNHSLNGGIVVGLDGYVIEVQARAIGILRISRPWKTSTKISGLPTGAAKEVLQRITGAFAKLRIPYPEVEILINLAPADMFKGGAWLDLPIAIIMLQAAGYLPDLPDHMEGDFVLMGELGIHGEIRRVPGALSLAYIARPGQQLIVPSGNEKECALILAKPGHEGCGVYPVGLLEDVVEFFKGRKTIDNALVQPIRFEDHIPKAIDFGLVRGQERAKEAAVIAAAGGHNLLTMWSFTSHKESIQFLGAPELYEAETDIEMLHGSALRSRRLQPRSCPPVSLRNRLLAEERATQKRMTIVELTRPH